MTWKNAECGTCEFAVEIEQKTIVVQANKEKLFECRKQPPQTLLMPVRMPQGQGLQAHSLYVKIGEHYPACSNYEEVQKPNDTMQRIPLEKLKSFSLPPDGEQREENKES